MSEFQFTETPRRDFAYVETTTPAAGIGEAMGEALPKAFAAVTAAGMAPAGPPLTRYLDFDEAATRMECGVPTASPFAGADDVRAGTIGGGETAVATHVGPYDTIGETWGALTAWITEQGRETSGPGWEEYLTDPGSEPDPAKWMTKIYVPVE